MPSLSAKLIQRCHRRLCRWWLVIASVIMTSFHSYVISSTSVGSFLRTSRCPGKALSVSLTYGQVNVRSRVHCAAQCFSDPACQSFLFEPGTRRCLLGSEPSSINCSNMAQAPSALQQYDMTGSCHNGGVLLAGGSCVCPQGLGGNGCNATMTDCDDYHKAGRTEDGVYWIHPPLSPEPFQVYCRMIRRPRTYVMNRVNNDADFTRGWQAYREGFGDLMKDFWLGLDKLHVLTHSQVYELRFRVRLRTNRNLYQTYGHVMVGREDQGYPLSLAGFIKGNLGDSLSPANSSRFSTPDHDNDNSHVHCARRHRAGFWFHGDGCTLCNPTGPLLQPENEKRLGIPDEVFWTKSLYDTVPYKLSVYLVNIIEKH